MATRARKKQGKDHQDTEEQLALLAQLKEVAVSIAVDVREERLARGAGYSVRSGRCLVEGREILFLDTEAGAGERIEVLVSFLADRDLDGVWLEPRLRRLIQGDDGSDETRSDSAGPS